MKRLAIVTNILAPYRIPVLNRVAEIQDVELKVFLAAEREPERLWSWFDDIRFAYEIRRGVSWRGRQGFVRHVNPGVVRSVRSWKPDAVIAGGTLTLSLLGFTAARLAACPFIWWVDATAESDAAMSYPWLAGAKRWLARASSGFVVSSTLTASYLVALGADPRRMSKSLLGVDPEPFGKAVRTWAASRVDIATELGLEGPVVLYVGQLEPYKGVDLLFDACELVGATEKISLLLLGKGSLEASLRARAARSPCTVVFAGFVQSEALPRIYAVADVFCLLSRYEPFGVVVSEAVAAGLPVICSRHAGASGDLVFDGENGFVVSPDDPAQVANRIRAVISDPAMRGRMRLASVEISRRLNPSVAARGIVDAAKQAIASQERRRR